MSNRVAYIIIAHSGDSASSGYVSSDDGVLMFNPAGENKDIFGKAAK